MRHEFSPEMTATTKDVQRNMRLGDRGPKHPKLGAVWSKFSSALHDAGDLKSDTEVVLTAVKCNGSSAWQFKNDMNSSVMATRFEYLIQEMQYQVVMRTYIYDIYIYLKIVA